MKVSIIGHFAYGKSFLDGQTVKTHTLDIAMREKYGESEIYTVDTCGIKKKIIALPFMLFGALRKSENVVILPAHNGVKIIVPLLCFLNKIFHRKLHYSVIGGWLPKFLKDRPSLAKRLKSFDGIYVETNTMKAALEAQGFNNIFVVPNCKKLPLLTAEEINKEYSEPYKLCTFSRVMKQKGIEDAISAVSSVNQKLGRTAFMLDIYGQVDSSEKEWFDGLVERFPQFVKYKGLVDSGKSVEVLKDYFALLFPTRFFTEGVPGTIIDAYAAGVPVIASRWESFADVVDDGVTGVSYEFENTEELYARLSEIADDPQIIISKKESCLAKAREFTPEQALSELFERL